MHPSSCLVIRQACLAGIIHSEVMRLTAGNGSISDKVSQKLNGEDLLSLEAASDGFKVFEHFEI